MEPTAPATAYPASGQGSTQVKGAITAAARREILEANHEAIATDSRARPSPRIALALVLDLSGAFPIDSAAFHAFRHEPSQDEMLFYGRDVFCRRPMTVALAQGLRQGATPGSTGKT